MLSKRPACSHMALPFVTYAQVPIIIPTKGRSTEPRRRIDTPDKEKKTKGRLKPPREAQRFHFVHDQSATIFRPKRHSLSAKFYH